MPRRQRQDPSQARTADDGHKRFFEFVMYTTGMLRYALRQFVAHVT
jgi:hypothetical protein